MEMPKPLTIADLLKMPVGAKVRARGAGFAATVSSVGKHLETPDKQRWQRVVLSDSTGGITADILLQKTPTGFNYVNRGNVLRIISAEIRAGVKNIMTDITPAIFFVTEYENEVATEPDYGINPDYAAFSEKEIKGKIRHGLCCAYIQSGKPVNKPLVLELTEFIVSGEIK